MATDRRFSEAEAYQRRIDTGEWNPPAMTEEERLASRRFEAYFAFETQWMAGRAAAKYCPTPELGAPPRGG